MVDQLRGAKAFVTGINSGIGCAIGEKLAMSGVSLVGSYHPNHEKAGVGIVEARRRISAVGKCIRFLTMDQTDPEQIARVLAEAESILKGLDYLVTVSSRQSPEPFLQTCPQEIQEQINVNLTGTILVIREAARIMIARADAEGAARRHRAIGVMGSVRGRIPVKPDAYEAAKAGLHHFVAGMSSIVGPHGISINAVAPGTIDSPIEYERYGGDADAYRAAWGQVTPGSLATPDDVAEAMLFLLNAPRSTTGEVLGVDGGYHCKPQLPMRPTE